MRIPRFRFGRICGATLATLVLAGCPNKEQPAAVPDAGAATAPAAADSGAPKLVTFSAQYEAQGSDGGGLAVIPLAPNETPVIESTSAIELRATPGLANYRVRLFDESDRAMVSDDSADESPEGLVYRIHLPAPLKSGHTYTLVVDARTGSTMTDTQGHPVEELRSPFKIAGEKEKPPPPAEKPGGKKRRR